MLAVWSNAALERACDVAPVVSSNTAFGSVNAVAGAPGASTSDVGIVGKLAAACQSSCDKHQHSGRNQYPPPLQSEISEGLRLRG